MIKRFDPACAGFATFAKPELEIEKLMSELQTINQRWQKAVAMDEAGEFLKMSSDRQARIESELSEMVNRAREIWETLEAECPEALENTYFLEP